MTNINIYAYNNYYNRMVKGYANLADYGTPLFTATDMNFNPGNDIDTEMIIGKTSYTGYGDYLIEYDNENNIKSRWFIIDTLRTKVGQYRVTLKRDLIYENYDLILNAPMIINKGMVPISSNLIFNSEGMSLNEIKTSEELINDSSSRFPWIVLYMAKNAAAQANIPVPTNWTGRYDEALETTLENSVYNPGTKASKTQSINIDFRFTAQYSSYGYTGNWRDYLYNTNGATLADQGSALSYPVWSELTTSVISSNDTQLKAPLQSAFDSTAIDTILAAIKASETSAVSDSTVAKYESVISAGSKIVRDSGGSYYEIRVERQDASETKYTHSSDAGYSEMVNTVTNRFSGFRSNEGQSNASYYPFKTTYRKYNYIVTAIPRQDLEFTVSVDPSNKNTTTDSECNIWLIPYADCYLNTVVPAQSGTVYKEDQLAIARAIAQKYDSACYDMQLLPYAPPFLRNIVTGTYVPTRFLNDKQFTLFTYDSKAKGVIFFSDVSNFSFDISKTISVPTDTIDFKLAVECDKYRLVSPNYNGQFEFNVARNRGVNYFNIDVTYRPYNPYIHINPNFKGLYGQDFDSATGLICQGDFSLPKTGDAFASYELNNKNYLNIFNREIQHMDFTQNIERRNAIATAITGTLMGGATGASAGGMAGGIYGAIAGGTIGTAASGIGGVLDYQYLKEQQKENKDFAIDNFNFQLGNVKSLPYSLNKVTPLTYNNKIFPFIEYYTCTDEEKQILRNKIEYTSMTLDTIDTLNNLKTNYPGTHFYQGTPIRLEGTELTADELYEIFNTLMKGVYI